MNQVMAVMKREWASFAGNDKGTMFVYVFILLVYSAVFTVNPYETLAARLWWVFYSVVVVSTVSGNSMISERLTGSLEVLFTSGVSRSAVLYGKVAYGFFMALLMGGLPFGVSRLITVSAGNPAELHDAGGFLLYASASLVNITSAAWLSVQLPNPRLIHFVNLLILSLLIGVKLTTGMADVGFGVAMVFASLVLLYLARRTFHGEKIVRKVSL